MYDTFRNRTSEKEKLIKLINLNDETLLLTYFLIHYTQYTIIPEKVQQTETHLLTNQSSPISETQLTYRLITDQ